MTDRTERDSGTKPTTPLGPAERMHKMFRDAEIPYRIINPDQPKGENANGKSK